MGPKPTKPEVGDDATIHCDSDTGFKLIQINLDWNNNGDGITVISILAIMVATVILMLLIRKLYSMYTAYRKRRHRRRGCHDYELGQLPNKNGIPDHSRADINSGVSGSPNENGAWNLPRE